jgi:hypothetical protein
MRFSKVAECDFSKGTFHSKAAPSGPALSTSTSPPHFWQRPAHFSITCERVKDSTTIRVRSAGSTVRSCNTVSGRDGSSGMQLTFTEIPQTALVRTEQTRGTLRVEPFEAHRTHAGTQPPQRSTGIIVPVVMLPAQPFGAHRVKTPEHSATLYRKAGLEYHSASSRLLRFSTRASPLSRAVFCLW